MDRYVPPNELNSALYRAELFSLADTAVISSVNVQDYALSSDNGDWGLALTRAGATRLNVYIPAGVYNFATTATMPISSRINGAGDGLTVLNFSCNDGIIFTGSHNSMLTAGVENLTMQIGVDSTGTAIHFDSANFTQKIKFYTRNVTFRGSSYALGFSGYSFTNYIRITNCNSATVDNCTIFGTYNFTTDPATQKQSIGVLVDGLSTTINLIDCNFISIYRGFDMQGTGEGFTINSSEFVFVYEGIRAAAGHIAGWVRGVHINSVGTGIELPRNSAEITGAHIYRGAGAYAGGTGFRAAIAVHDAEDVILNDILILIRPGDATQAFYGIKTNNGSGITGNNIIIDGACNEGHGISINATSHTNFSGVLFRDCTYSYKVFGAGDNNYLEYQSVGTSGEFVVTPSATNLVQLASTAPKNMLASTDAPWYNGNVSFEATDDTHLKVKYKGSDGVVRSSTLTLS